MTRLVESMDQEVVRRSCPENRLVPLHFSVLLASVVESRLYEWRRERNRKVPVWIHFKNNEPFAFAGLWDAWLDRNSGELLNTFTIITTDANALLERIHDRMPVMYDREMGQQWLERNFGSSAVTLAAALRPPPSERMEAWDVSTLVNAPENDTPEMHRAVISRRSANRAVAAPIATLKLSLVLQCSQVSQDGEYNQIPRC